MAQFPLFKTRRLATHAFYRPHFLQLPNRADTGQCRTLRGCLLRPRRLRSAAVILLALGAILVRAPAVNGSGRLWLAVCINGELRSVAVIQKFSGGVFVRGSVIDGSSRVWLAVCIRGELRSVAVILLVLDGILVRPPSWMAAVSCGLPYAFTAS